MCVWCVPSVSSERVTKHSSNCSRSLVMIAVVSKRVWHWESGEKKTNWGGVRVHNRAKGSHTKTIAKQPTAFEQMEKLPLEVYNYILSFLPVIGSESNACTPDTTRTAPTHHSHSPTHTFTPHTRTTHSQTTQTHAHIQTTHNSTDSKHYTTTRYVTHTNILHL